MIPHTNNSTNATRFTQSSFISSRPGLIGGRSSVLGMPKRKQYSQSELDEQREFQRVVSEDGDDDFFSMDKYSNKRSRMDATEDDEYHLGGTSGRGAYGPPGNQEVSTIQDPIFTGARHSVIPYQLSVVTLCRVARIEAEAERRRMESHKYAASELWGPLNDTRVLRIHKGEYVYSRIGADGTAIRDVHEYDGYPEVISCVNLLPKTVRLKFEGFMAFNQPAGGVPDDVGTLQRFGDCTGFWTGPYNGRAGQIVYFSEKPFTTLNALGQEEPAIRIKGFPGQEGEKDLDGISRGKFVPSMYTLNDADTLTFFAQLRKSIELLVRDEMGDPSNPFVNLGNDGDDADQRGHIESLMGLIEKVKGEMNTHHFLKQADQMPARDYVEIYIYYTFYLHINSSIQHASLAKGLTKKFVRLIQDRFKKWRKESSVFLSSIGSQAVRYDHFINNPAMEVELQKESSYFTKSSAIAGPVTLSLTGGAGGSENVTQDSWVPAYSNFAGTKMSAVFWIIKVANEILLNCYARQEDFLKSHCMGTLMRDVSPGSMCDMLLGVFMR